jgi:S-adenosylmethionine hydrolase
MQIITFSSDFGQKDPYVGIVKGIILREIRDRVIIVDLTHNIPSFKVTYAAYVIKSAFPFFPENTIHLVVVDPTVGSQRRALAAYSHRQWFIAPDNGLLSYILPSANIVREITSFTPKSSTFHARDVFAYACVYIFQRKEEKLGKLTKDYVLLDLAPFIEKRRIVGKVIYIDHFGNLITNILETHLPASPYDRAAMKVKIKGEEVPFCKIYSDVPLGCLLALINSSGHLEVSANQSNAKELLFAEEEDIVEIIW